MGEERMTRWNWIILFACLFAASAQAADWVAECRSQGFDPEQLACRTCTILEPDPLLVAACQACCQSWLDTKRISKPYEAAVLVDRGGGDEVATFLKEDWDDVVRNKGAARLKHIKAATDQQYNFFSRPSQLLFFDQFVAGVTDLTKLTRKAVETVSLDGMKREDMKDMLLTLLP